MLFSSILRLSQYILPFLDYFIPTNYEPGIRARQECRLNAIKMIECQRILNGSKARVPSDILKFPHMALIGFKSKDKEWMWNCGGSLIHPEWILTAAHCLYDPAAGPPERVLLGTTTFEEEEDEDVTQSRNITKMIKHPEYEPPLKYNDIALLKLDKPIKVGDIRIACLNVKNEVPTSATVTGFGKTDFDSIVGSKTMMRVDVDIIPEEKCVRSLKSLMKKNGVLRYGILPSQLCAGDLRNGGRDTCQGDSGGPLQFFPEKYDCVTTFPLYEILGVTSFGRFCGFQNSPGVYTNVEKYVSWIEDILWP